MLHGRVLVEQQREMLGSGYEYVRDELDSFGEDPRRVIILSTDVLESSVTIRECEVVIDTCAHWRKWSEGSSWKHSLVTELIMRDEELQRQGRAKGVQAGLSLVSRISYYHANTMRFFLSTHCPI